MSDPNDRSEATARLNAALKGRYHIREEIGRGGMATVYLADDLRHGRPVALKVLDPELAAALGAERFLTEIRTTANLQHPHILPLFDSGEADGFLFYVMPLVEGESLRDRLDRDHQLPVENAVQLVRKLAEALDYAHRHCVVHRDIKPGNVLLHDGEPVLADFGIALAMESVAGNRLTETGRSLGTPQYMSPEQATGDQHVGPAADIYALGCVLYEALVGEPPFHGSTPQAILGRIITEAPPSATKERSSVPEHVDSAIRKALEKLPADRFQTAGEMSTALSDVAFRYGKAGADSSRSSSSLVSSRTAILALWALVATALATWALTRPTPSEPVERWQITYPLAENTSAMPVVSPQGSSLLLPNSDRRLWLKEGSSLQPRLIAEAEQTGLRYSVADFSPDGDEFVFIADGQLRVTDITGERVTTLTDSAFCCPRWERDGFVYFTGSRFGIDRILPTGGSREVITRLDSAEVDPHSDFALLPSGKAGVFYRWGPTLEPQIEAIDLEVGRRTPLVPGRKPYVTPDGDLVYWHGRELRVHRIDQNTLTLQGAPATVEQAVRITEPGGYPMYSISSRGTLLYQGGGPGNPGNQRGDAHLYWMSRSGQANLVDSEWSFLDPGWGNFGWSLSPDQDRIATFWREGDNFDIWIKDLPDGSFYPLTFHPSRDMNPTWSPDGREILFISDRGGNMDLWAKRADGSGDARLLYDSEDIVADGRWTPNRDWLVMRIIRANDDRDIIAVRTDQDDRELEVAATSALEDGPALSPDGRWLAYTSDTSGQSEVYVVSFPDLEGPRRISEGGGLRPVWAPAGEELFYVGSERQMQSVRLRTEGVPSVVSRETLFSIPQEYHVQGNADFYSVARDGERFLMGTRGLFVPPEQRRQYLYLVRNWWAVVEEAQAN